MTSTVKINGIELPIEKEVKYLEVTLDSRGEAEN